VIPSTRLADFPAGKNPGCGSIGGLVHESILIVVKNWRLGGVAGLGRVVGKNWPGAVVGASLLHTSLLNCESSDRFHHPFFLTSGLRPLTG